MGSGNITWVKLSVCLGKSLPALDRGTWLPEDKVKKWCWLISQNCCSALGWLKFFTCQPHWIHSAWPPSSTSCSGEQVPEQNFPLHKHIFLQGEGSFPYQQFLCCFCRHLQCYFPRSSWAKKGEVRPVRFVASLANLASRHWLDLNKQNKFQWSWKGGHKYCLY